MRKRNKLDPDVRKQQIIDAAAAVFARKGFYGASMGDIVRESGLSKGGLYWHFNSKDDIVAAVIDQFFTAELEEIAQILITPMPAAAKMRQLTLQMMADTVKELSVYLNIWLEFYAVAAREGVFRERMLTYLRQWIDMYTALIQQGIDNGEFRPVDARDVAVTAGAQFEGLILLWALDPENVDVLALVETAVDILLRGLKE